MNTNLLNLIGPQIGKIYTLSDEFKHIFKGFKSGCKVLIYGFRCDEGKFFIEVLRPDYDTEDCSFVDDAMEIPNKVYNSVKDTDEYRSLVNNTEIGMDIDKETIAMKLWLKDNMKIDERASVDMCNALKSYSSFRTRYKIIKYANYTSSVIVPAIIGFIISSCYLGTNTRPPEELFIVGSLSLIVFFMLIFMSKSGTKKEMEVKFKLSYIIGRLLNENRY